MKDLLKIKTPITNADEDYLLNLPQYDSGNLTIAVTDDIKNATLTIQKNSAFVGSFSANASSNTTIDLDIPIITDTSGSEKIEDNDHEIYPVTRDTPQTITSYKTFDCNDGNNFGHIDNVFSQLEFYNSEAHQDYGLNGYAQLGLYTGTSDSSFRINFRDETAEDDYTLDVGTSGLTLDVGFDNPLTGDRFYDVHTIIKANNTNISFSRMTYADQGLSVANGLSVTGGFSTSSIVSPSEESYTNKISLGGGNITLTAASGANSTKTVRLSTSSLTAVRDISFPDVSGSLATIAINPATTTGTLTGLTINGTAYAIPQGTVTGSSLTANKIILGNGTTTIKTSTYNITPSSVTWDDTSDVYVPTMKAIIARWPKIIDIR